MESGKASQRTCCNTSFGVFKKNEAILLELLNVVNSLEIYVAVDVIWLYPQNLYTEEGRACDGAVF
jgi:hypothetical protein